MPVHGGMAAKQQQTVTLSPEHIMGKAVLKMGLLEAQQFIQQQFAENPALVIEEVTLCPACGSSLIGDFCPTCGSEKVDTSEEKLSADNDEWQPEVYDNSGFADDEQYDPFARVASPKSLAEFLTEQVRLSFSPNDAEIAEEIIDCLDEDGYLREPLVEIAGRLGISVPQLEIVLAAVQALDPPGLAARDLRECLLLQLARVDADSSEKDLANAIVRDCWDDLSKMKIDKIAKQLKTDSDDITDALSYLRENTTPHPTTSFRDVWDKMYPCYGPKIRPDVVVYRTDSGFAADIPDPITGRVAVDEMYSSLWAELSRNGSTCSEADKAHVREYVGKAKSLIEAIEFRKSSLRRIIDELLAYQAGFFKDGPLALKSLTKKDLALKIGLHESTVCRATQDKYLRLPSGELIAFDVLFDSALPIKERVKELAVRQLTDGEIAEKLAEDGTPIARRTVAKYRDQIGVLPLEYRLVRRKIAKQEPAPVGP